MADNVLGVLFGDIADAIRSKTGETATMKPAEFPEKINGIEVGTGGASSGEVWAKKEGSFQPTSAIHTVTHNIGVVPELVIVHIGATPPVNCQFFSVGFNTAMANSFEENVDHSFAGLIMPDSGFMRLTTKQGIETNGDSAFWPGEQTGVIRNATETSFTVGGSGVGVYNTGLVAGTTYYWIAYYRKTA